MGGSVCYDRMEIEEFYVEVDRMIDRLMGIRRSSVPMRAIRHSRRRCYVLEGHGGREIEAWPIYWFFALYIQGETEKALKEFAAWYADQYSRYREVPKQCGGMQGGSLDRTIRRKGIDPSGWHTDGSCEDARSDDLIRVIEARVRERFDLADSILNEGYKTNRKDPVIAVEEGDRVYLIRGHHRVAVLRALGLEEFPDMVIFKNSLAFKIWAWRYKIRGVIGHVLPFRRYINKIP